MKNALKFVSALFLTAGMVVACASGDTSSTTNGGGNSSGDNTPAACSKGTDACGKCGDDSCCTELEACDNDAKCKALSSCVDGCVKAAGSMGDPTNCINACPNAMDQGTVTLYEKTNTCEETSCKQQCLCASDGSACGDCQTGKCCDSLAACEIDTDCLTLFDCVVNCGADQNCANNCGASSTQAAVNEFNAFAMCFSNNCTMACAN